MGEGVVFLKRATICVQYMCEIFTWTDSPMLRLPVYSMKMRSEFSHKLWEVEFFGRFHYSDLCQKHSFLRAGKIHTLPRSEKFCMARVTNSVRGRKTE